MINAKTVRKRKVIDAGVWIGWLNLDDAFNEVCEKFFSEEVIRKRSVQVVIPLHLVFEISSKVRAKRRAGLNNWKSSFRALGPEFYPIDMTFLTRCQRADIWARLAVSKVGSQDLIYAAIAHLENIPLVTTDRKLANGLGNVIKVELLKS